MERGARTGRHTRGLDRSWMESNRKTLSEQQVEAVKEFPENAVVMNKILDGIDFDAVHDMFRQINARSQGPLNKNLNADSLIRPHERVSAAPTNRISRNDIFLLNLTHGQSEGLMQYHDASNHIKVDVGSKTLSKLAAMKEESTSDVEREAKLRALFGLCQGIFHELCHAYSFNDFIFRQEGDVIEEFTRTGTMRANRLTEKMDGQETRWRTIDRRDGLFWLEGWNDLQTSLRMQEYFKRRSLVYEDVVINADTPQIQHGVSEVFFNSGYGHASYAIWSIADRLSEDTGVPMDVVLDSFTKVFQTHRGTETLVNFLRQFLGDELCDSIMGTDVEDMDSKILAHDIMEKVNAPSHWKEYLLEIITRPDQVK